MDEIFHIPQLQVYCSSNYLQYHPAITTPPGLYWIALGPFQVMSHLASLFTQQDSQSKLLQICEDISNIRLVICAVALLTEALRADCGDPYRGDRAVPNLFLLWIAILH
eukprot:TRINITY_DN9902_c0_g1_i1.p2 TRINITY_DN9902_c0_g1~~TRINITY_DN9902_c0_g1_i1.p2  ORF type:complete len:109 (-),score=8.13 TRINITY_DN9902_c0_g1_i1:121-447(-)